jgi:hypothetical protein
MSATLPPAEIRSRPVLDLVDYWQRKRGTRLAPAWREIEPGDMKALLPSLVIAEVLEQPFDLRYRLVGSDVVDAYGYDFTGLQLRYMPVTTGLELWLDSYRGVVEERRPGYGRYHWQAAPDLKRIVETVVLPLSEDGVRTSRLVGIEDWGALRGFGSSPMVESVWQFEPP